MNGCTLPTRVEYDPVPTISPCAINLYDRVRGYIPHSLELHPLAVQPQPAQHQLDIPMERVISPRVICAANQLERLKRFPIINTGQHRDTSNTAIALVPFSLRDTLEWLEHMNLRCADEGTAYSTTELRGECLTVHAI